MNVLLSFGADFFDSTWKYFPSNRLGERFISFCLLVAFDLETNHGFYCMAKLTHFDEDGNARMVKVADKSVTNRQARVSGKVSMRSETAKLIMDRKLGKGDVISVARIAGIMAAKKTSELIPLCHPIALDSVRLNFKFEDENTLCVEAVVNADQKTGVEMEAFTAVSIACLTVYDMCKSVDRSMVISEIQLEQKSGGKSGDFHRSNG